VFNLNKINTALPGDVLDKLEKMKEEAIEEMIKRGWDRQKAQEQADAFS
jgi:hypothetical protein